jgi:uncharacterized protein (DUF924 family)
LSAESHFDRVQPDQSFHSPSSEVLQFWFDRPDSEAASYKQRRKLWFGKKPEFDQQIRDRFSPLYQQAAAGELDDWQQSTFGCLALILLLDQFPRNLFRGNLQAYATDWKALALAKQAIAQGFDQALNPLQRIFIYLPLEHSESAVDQHQSVALFRQLASANPELADCFDYALRHQAVIDRFGRFPHRNQILDRPSTPEEVAFLKQSGSSF